MDAIQKGADETHEDGILPSMLEISLADPEQSDEEYHTNIYILREPSRL